MIEVGDPSGLDKGVPRMDFEIPEPVREIRQRVQHFIDNTVALSALVHGYSGKADLAKMVNAFFLQMAGLRASVYFDYVPS